MSDNEEANRGNGLDGSPASEAETTATHGESEVAEQPTQQPNWQKRHDRLLAEVQPLRAWQDKGFTPARIAELMGTFENVLKDPALGKAISTYVATGRAEFPQAEKPAEEDPYEDPGVRSLRDQMSALEQRIASLQSATQQTATVTASERVAAMNEKFLADYKELTAEESQEFMRQLMPRLDQMIAGNPAAFQRLDAETFEAIALPVLNRVAPLRGLGLRGQQQQRDTTRQHATDAPLRVGTNGQEPSARKQAARLTERAVTHGIQQAMRDAFRRTGRSVE